MTFAIDSFFNPHLTPGTRRIDAVLTVTQTGEGPVTGQLAYMFLVDVSGSMGDHDRLNHTKIALRRALDLLPASALFGIVAFNDSARVLVPLTVATESARAQAHKAVQGLVAGGGTAMSRGLREVREQFRHVPDAFKQVLLLTDGENAAEDQRDLEREIAQCKGVLQCDCRGIGTGWRPDQLRLIANALLGRADAVCAGEALEADFRATLESALKKGVARAVLRLWTPKTARLVSVKQVLPDILDLTSLARIVDEKTTDFPTGAWGNESRDYHVGIEVPAGLAGDEILACRPSIVFESLGAEVKVAGPNVVAAWTSDEALTTRINPQVAHYTGQTELADSIKEGLEAKARGEVDVATRLLGRAVKIAADSGNEEVTRRLRKVVDVVDEAQGTVRIKASANKAAELELDMGGTRTVRRRSVTP